MKIYLLIWITLVFTTKTTYTYVCSSKSITSGHYQAFTSIKLAYSAIIDKDCDKLEGKIIKKKDISKEILNVMEKTLNNFKVIPEFCQFNGTVLWHENIIKFVDKSLCQYNKGKCAFNDEPVFWNNGSQLDPLIIFEDNLDFWEIENIQATDKLKFLSHKILNLTLRVEEVKVNNETIFFASKNNVFLKSVENITDLNEYFNLNVTEKYFGHLTDRILYDDLDFPNENTTNDNRTDKICCLPKYIPQDSEATNNTFNTIIITILLLSVSGNCLGMLCVLLFCYKNGFSKKIKYFSSQVGEKNLACENSNGMTFIQDNDLYNEPSH